MRADEAIIMLRCNNMPKYYKWERQEHFKKFEK